MHPSVKLDRHDWLQGVLLGAAFGTVVLGVGSRWAMHEMALLQGQPGGFTAGGTMTVIFMGAVSGVVGALALLATRTWLRAHRLTRSVIYWAFLIAISLRGLKPIDADRLLLFMPFVLLYGAGLQYAACRRAERRRAERRHAGLGPLTFQRSG